MGACYYLKCLDPLPTSFRPCSKGGKKDEYLPPFEVFILTSLIVILDDFLKLSILLLTFGLFSFLDSSTLLLFDFVFYDYYPFFFLLIFFLFCLLFYFVCVCFRPIFFLLTSCIFYPYVVSLFFWNFLRHYLVVLLASLSFFFLFFLFSLFLLFYRIPSLLSS